MSDCVSLWQSELQRELEHKNNMQVVLTLRALKTVLGFIFRLLQNLDIHYTADTFFFRSPPAQKTMDILTLEIQLPLCPA